MQPKKKWVIWFRYTPKEHKASDLILELTNEEALELMDYMPDPYELREAGE